MADTFALEVVTPEVTLFAGPATAVVLRTSIGALTVLAGHAPFIGDVVPGQVKVDREGEPTLRLAVHGGFIQVDTSAGAARDEEGVSQGSPVPGLTTRVTLLAGVAERAEDIDVSRAQESLAAANDRLAQLRGRGEGAPEDFSAAAEVALAEADLRRAQVRVDVATTGVS